MFLSVFFLVCGWWQRWSVCVCLGKKLQGEFSEGSQFPKLSVVGYRLNIMGRFSFFPNISSCGDIASSCELNAKGNTFTFCDDVSCGASKAVRRNVLNCRLYFVQVHLTMVRMAFMVWIVHYMYGKSLRILRQYIHFRYRLLKCLVFQIFKIQWPNNTVSAFVASFLGEGWSTT